MSTANEESASAQSKTGGEGIVYWETGGPNMGRPKWPLTGTDILKAQSESEEAASVTGVVYWERGGVGSDKWPLSGTDILKDQSGGAVASGEGIVHWESGDLGRYKWQRRPEDILQEQADAEGGESKGESVSK